MSYQNAMALMSKGVSRPTLYEVRMPSLMGFGARDYIRMYCKATAIPAVNAATAMAAGQEHMGVTREQPVAVVYSKPLSLTIIERSDFVAYKSVRSWFDQVAANANPPSGGSLTGRSQRMRYYDSFVKDIQLVKLEQPPNGGTGPNDYIQTLSVDFINAYPISIGEVALASDSYDSQTEFSVDFTYETYNVSTPLFGAISQGVGGLGSAGGVVDTALGVLGTLTNL